jgi:hypothetical protein
MWFESDTGRTFIWYNDGTSSQWVQVAPGGNAVQTAESFNYIINGSLQWSQWNAGVAGATRYFYAADMFYMDFTPGATWTTGGFRVQW